MQPQTGLGISPTGRIPMKPQPRWACDECGGAFRQLGNLRKHKAEVHRKNKPYPCVLCGSRFSRKNARDVHIRSVHHGSRPHECIICSKRFKNRSDLNKHVRTVERGERPYQCEICGHAFGERAKLKRHSKIHVHKSELLTIDECSDKQRMDRNISMDIVGNY